MELLVSLRDLIKLGRLGDNFLGKLPVVWLRLGVLKIELDLVIELGTGDGGFDCKEAEPEQ